MSQQKGTKRKQRPWWEAGGELFWAVGTLEQLVKWPRRQSKRVETISMGLLVSMYLFLVEDDDFSWERALPRGCEDRTRMAAAARIVENVSGFVVNPDAVWQAVKRSYAQMLKQGASDCGRKGDRGAKTIQTLREWLASSYQFEATAVQILADPVAVHMVQQQVLLEEKSADITQLYIANRGLHELCEELDQVVEAELAEKQNVKLQLTEARRQLKDVENAVAACGSVYDSQSLLQYFCMAETKVRELDKLKRYGGGAQLRKANDALQAEVDRLAQSCQAAQAEQEQMLEHMYALRQQQIREQNNWHKTRGRYRTVKQEWDESVKSAGQYAMCCGDYMNRLMQHSSELQAYCGALWEHFKVELDGKEAKLNAMRQEMEELQTFETQCGGTYNAEIRKLFWSFLQRGISPKSAQPLVGSLLRKRYPKLGKLPSLATIHNMPQEMLYAAKMLVASKMHAANLRFRERTDVKDTFKKYRGNFIRHCDHGQRGQEKYLGQGVGILTADGKSGVLPMGITLCNGGTTRETNELFLDGLCLLKELAYDMGLPEPDKIAHTFSVCAHIGSMGDRAANQAAHNKFLSKTVKEAMAKLPEWKEMSGAEQELYSIVVDASCCLHAICNLGAGISAEFLRCQNLLAGKSWIDLASTRVSEYLAHFKCADTDDDVTICSLASIDTETLAAAPLLGTGSEYDFTMQSYNFEDFMKNQCLPVGSGTVQSATHETILTTCMECNLDFDEIIEKVEQIVAEDTKDFTIESTLSHALA